MELSKQVVSLELAKKLKELGVKQESYFSWVGDDIWDKTQQSDYQSTSTLPSDQWISLFTVAELGEILTEIKDDSAIYEFHNNRKGLHNYHIWHEEHDKRNDFKYVLDAHTEADARAKLLIYLIENKLINL